MVRRPALESLIERCTERRLTVVSAGPGWGKTVAVAQWAAATRRRVAWLSLEPHDDVPGAFWSDVLETLCGSGAVPPGNALRGLRVPAAASHDFRSQLLRALEDLPEPVALVLDDFHHVQRPEVVDGVEDLLRYPLPLRLVVVTRVDPLVRVHRLRVEGELGEVVASDLAFDAQAVAALASSRGLPLSHEDVARVLEATDGWPVGVRLQLRSPGGPGAKTRPDQDTSDYLVAEVLDRLEPEVQRVLLMTCVTRSTCADLVEAILPGGEAVVQWRSFVERNDFVSPLGADGTWFRYHPLLREMLLGMLAADDPESWRLAHRNAATWLVGHGEPVRALELAARIEDWALFCQVFVDSAAPALVSVDREQVLELVGQVPFADLGPDPAVELCAAALAVLRGRFQAAAAHVERARELVPSGAPPPLVALLEILAASAARGLGDAATTAASGAAALAVLDAAPLPTPAWPAYQALAANAHAVGLFWGGDLVAAREHLESLVRTSAGAPPLLPLLNARSYLALAAAVAGDLERAAREGRQVLSDARELGWASYLQCRCAYTAVAWVAVLRGAVDEADQMLALALASDLGGEEPPTEIAIHLLQALVAVQRGRTRAAQAAVQAAGQLAGARSPVLADLAWRAALETAELAGQDAPGRSGAPQPSAALRLVVDARTHLSRGEQREAVRVAAFAQARARADADELSEVEAWLVTAAAHQRSGDPVRCDAALDEAIAVAAGSVLVRPFLRPGPPALAERIHARLDRHPGELAAQVHRAAHYEPPAREPEPLIDPLTSRELAILGALPTMQTNSEIAADFYVSVNTVKAHLKALYRKLGVDSRREAVRRARELGLLP